MTKGKCFIQSYALIPRGQPASNDYLIQVQRPNPLTSIGVVSKWPSQFQSSLQDWLKPLLQNYMYLHLTSSAACWYSCSLTGIAERTPPATLQMQISDSVSCFLRNSTATYGGNGPSFSMFKSVAPTHTHDHQKPCWVSLSLSRDPLQRPSLFFNPRPESANAASDQNGHSPQLLPLEFLFTQSLWLSQLPRL